MFDKYLLNIFLILFEFFFLDSLKSVFKQPNEIKLDKVYTLLYTYIITTFIYNKLQTKNNILNMNISFLINIIIYNLISSIVLNTNNFNYHFLKINFFILISINIFYLIYKKLNIKNKYVNWLYSVINNIINYIYIDYAIDTKFDFSRIDIIIYIIFRIIINGMSLFIRSKF
jgi:hypothetical protein